MVNIDTIRSEILDLEKRDTSYATIERLAWLYIVLDHLAEGENTSRISGNEFLEACSGVPIDSILRIFSDHMDSLSVTYPKEYDAILKRIKNLRG